MLYNVSVPHELPVDDSGEWRNRLCSPDRRNKYRIRQTVPVRTRSLSFQNSNCIRHTGQTCRTLSARQTRPVYVFTPSPIGSGLTYDPVPPDHFHSGPPIGYTSVYLGGPLSTGGDHCQCHRGEVNVSDIDHVICIAIEIKSMPTDAQWHQYMTLWRSFDHFKLAF